MLIVFFSNSPWRCGVSDEVEGVDGKLTKNSSENGSNKNQEDAVISEMEKDIGTKLQGVGKTDADTLQGVQIQIKPISPSLTDCGFP